MVNTTGRVFSKWYFAQRIFLYIRDLIYLLGILYTANKSLWEQEKRQVLQAK